MSNEYRPWDAFKMTEAEYFKMRYLEVRKESETFRSALEVATTAMNQWIADDGFECGYLIYDAAKKINAIQTTGEKP